MIFPRTRYALLCLSFFTALAVSFSDALADADGRGFDFDGVRAGDVVFRKLAVSNLGKEAYTIKSADGSCSSLTILGFSPRVFPGELGEIWVKFHPVHSGSADLEVLVQTSQKEETASRFHWAGNILSAPKEESAGKIELPWEILATPAELERALTDVTLIDVRTSQEFNRCHLEGAVNWQVQLLRQMGTLQRKKIILVSKGVDEERVLGEALRLRAAGFATVRVLHGGIEACKRMHFPFVEATAERSQLNYITPTEYFASRQDQWEVIDFRNQSPFYEDALPFATRLLPDSPNLANTISEIAKAAFNDGQSSRILVMSDFGERYESFANKIPAESQNVVYFFDGGFRAYQRFVEQRRAFGSRREMTLTSNKADSGSTTETLLNTTGCSSCPKKQAAK